MPLDVLGEIEDGLSFDELVPDTISVEIGDTPVRVLSLSAIVSNKRRSKHPKDQQVLAVLEETLRHAPAMVRWAEAAVDLGCSDAYSRGWKQLLHRERGVSRS